MITIQYLSSNVIQTKHLVSKEYSDLVFANKKKLIEMLATKYASSAMTANAKLNAVVFEQENKCKFAFDEVVHDSPMGLALLTKDSEGICTMILPETQGGKCLFKVLE